jgi:aspartokinase
MIEIDYPRILKKTPGVFSVIYNELAENNISIIDALISSNEHILVIDEEKLLTAFEHIYELCNN